MNKNIIVLIKRLKSRIRGKFYRWREQPRNRLVLGEEFDENVDIASLICPLRYDIVVRA